MSVRVMTAVFDHSQSRLADRLVLLVIADRSDDDGTGCYRGKESIARMARVDRATVTRAIQNLVALGELEVEHRHGRTSLYRIVLEGVGAICAGSEGEGRRKLRRGEAQDAPGSRRNLRPNTSLDTSNSPSALSHWSVERLDRDAQARALDSARAALEGRAQVSSSS